MTIWHDVEHETRVEVQRDMGAVEIMTWSQLEDELSEVDAIEIILALSMHGQIKIWIDENSLLWIRLLRD